jgi:hypothetical protein
MKPTEIARVLQGRYEGLTALAASYRPVVEARWAPVKTRIQALRDWWEANHMTARLPYGIGAAVVLGSLLAANQGYFLAPEPQPAHQVAARVAPIGTLTLADAQGSPQVASQADSGNTPGTNVN